MTSAPQPLEPVFVGVGIVVFALAALAPFAILAWVGKWRAHRALTAWAPTQGLTIEKVESCSSWGAQRGPFNGTGGWTIVFHITARNAHGETRSGYVSFGNFLAFGTFALDVRW